MPTHSGGCGKSATSSNSARSDTRIQTRGTDPITADPKQLTVDVYDRAIQKKLATGELIAVDNQIDTTTGTVKIRASFPNTDFALFPNQFVNARLLVRTLDNVTLIPSSTIQQNGQTSFVYVVQDNVAHLKNIKPGVADNGMTQVEGVNPGDVLADDAR